jgi:exodeoxyribonuclease V alpha subunit
MDILQGVIKVITYYNPENGYGVLRVEDKDDNTYTVVGSFPDVHVGERFEFQGQWIRHPKFGRQFQSPKWEQLPPDDTQSVIAYLSSGLFSGIGPRTAEKIAEFFGEDTMSILEADPESIFKVPGFTGVKGQRFVENWKEKIESRRAVHFLLELEIPSGTAMRIAKKFGSDTEEKISENPYSLLGEVHTLGFQKLDQIAYKLGLEKDGWQRVSAGLLYTLRAAASEGHVFLPRLQLLTRAQKLLGLYNEEGENRLVFGLDQLVQDEKIVLDNDCCYMPWLHRCEQDCAASIRSLLAANPPILPSRHETELEKFADTEGLHYSEEQQRCIFQAVQSRFFILTGGPGTGKTTTLRGILHLLDVMKEKTILAAPTGRAAKRMSELCGAKAYTLHRLLEYNPTENSFLRNPEKPLDADRIIIDEVSMMDAWISYHLLRSLSPEASIILIGDPDQLPSVGPGNVLRELLDSPRLPKGQLTQIFRQKAHSEIAVNAHRINSGEMPECTQQGDFITYHYRTEEDARRIIEGICKNEQQSGVDPMEDIQILTPMKKGGLGNFELNKFLQDLLNPGAKEVICQGIRYRVGDRILLMRNNYEWNVFNGDIGRIISLDKDARTAVLSFDGRSIEAEFTEMDQVLPAYSMTIHKSQGSEYPITIVVLDPSHNHMLQKNLFYTAITRARHKAIILSTPWAIQKCVSNTNLRPRYTRLGEWVRAGDTFMDWLENEE